MSAMEICNDSQKGWEFANTLGEGAYGEVKLAINSKTQETRAVKIISLNLLTDKTSIQKEVLIHKTLNHENIIKYYSSFQQLDKFYIILEYASGGELFDRIEPDYGMKIDLAHNYFCQLINGVEYLHSKGIVHRDLKPENLLLNDNDRIKIADFGLATLYQYKGQERSLTSPCGTAPYVAPEVLCKNEYKAQPTDIWSCGIVLVAMLAGELPWDKPVFDCADFVSWIKHASYQRTPWCKIENTALSLIRNILKYDPSQRLTIKQIKLSQWFVRVHKSQHYEPVNLYNDGHDENMRFSQPISYNSHNQYIYFNEPDRLVGTEVEVTDSQQNCDCSMHSNPSFSGQNPSTILKASNHFESFSQPISTENMILNSQLPATQTYNSSQYSQSPFLKLVKRMTRMFIHRSVDGCTEELKKLFEKFMYDYKEAVMNQRQRQLTVTTSDKRQNLLTFKINIIEINSQNEVLVDFRLSRGDGLEFKKIFMKIKSNLSHMVCKKFVFGGVCASQKV